MDDKHILSLRSYINNDKLINFKLIHMFNSL